MTVRAVAAVAAVVAVIAVACSSSPSAEACDAAAVAQAAAEERWAELLEEHVGADTALQGNPTSEDAQAAHDDSADRLFSARVTMILAESKTRARCG